ncbi:unnamed protein product [Citrullus colocynthis]|uniref:Uncharacterized protein n=1 Tax=Citrullus colocynthis TaxID=252529 RepID=A0ABP0ZCW0_9ROSI
MYCGGVGKIGSGKGVPFLFRLKAVLIGDIALLQQECQLQAQQPIRSSDYTLIDQPSPIVGNCSNAFLKMFNIENTSHGEKSPFQCPWKGKALLELEHICLLMAEPTTHQGYINGIMAIHWMSCKLHCIRKHFISMLKMEELRSELTSAKSKLNDPEHLSGQLRSLMLINLT